MVKRYEYAAVRCWQFWNVTNVLSELVDCATDMTSIFAYVDGPHDAASRKIDHIALPTEYIYQETSIGR